MEVDNLNNDSVDSLTFNFDYMKELHEITSPRSLDPITTFVFIETFNPILL